MICLMQSIWVPKLVFSNTEQKIITKNDEKAFAVARYGLFLCSFVPLQWQGRNFSFVPLFLCSDKEGTFPLFLCSFTVAS